MKMRNWIILLLILFLIPSVFAVSITLDETNGGVEQDFNFDEDGTPATTSVRIKCMNTTHGSVGYSRWNLSLIPLGSTITNVTLNVLRAAGTTGDPMDIYYWNNDSWTDTQVTQLCGVGANPYCAAVTSTMETYVMSFVTKAGWHPIFSSNLTTSVNAIFGLGRDDYTMVFNYTDGCVAGVDNIQYGNSQYIAGQRYNLTIEYDPPNSYTTPKGLEVNFSNINIPSSTWGEVYSTVFNISKVSQITFPGAIQIEKLSGGSSNDIYGRIKINGSVVSTSKLSSVSSVGEPKVSSFKQFIYQAGINTYELSIEMYATGAGASRIDHFNGVIIKSETSDSTKTNMTIEDFDVSYSSTTFTNQYNYSNNALRPTLILDRMVVEKTTTGHIDSYTYNPNDSVQSPYYSRYVTATGTGTTQMYSVDNGTTASFLHQFYSRVNSGTATANKSVVMIDLKDELGNVVHYNQSSNNNTNLTNFITAVAGKTHIANASITLEEGDSVLVLVDASITSESGNHQIILWVNETSGLCHSHKDRQVKISSQKGNGFDVMLCEGLTTGMQYNFSYDILVTSGESSRVYDESLVLLDFTEFNGSESITNVTPKKFISFTYPYYNFKISNETGMLTNFTVAGRTGPVIKNLTFSDFDNSLIEYNISNVQLDIFKNGSLYDIITVSYNLLDGVTEKGYCNDTYKAYADSNIFYVEHKCEQSSGVLQLCNDWSTAYLGGSVVNTFKLTEGSTWTSSVLSGAGDIYWDTGIKTGTGTANVVRYNRSFMRIVNTTNGYVTIGSSRFSSNEGNGMNKQLNPTWWTADINDTDEFNTNMIPSDWLVAYPNFTIYVSDHATDPFIRKNLTFVGLDGYTPPTGTSCSLTAAWDENPPADRTIAKDLMRSTLFIMVGNQTEDFQAEAEEVFTNSYYDADSFTMVGNRYTSLGLCTDKSPFWENRIDFWCGWQTDQFSRTEINEESLNELSKQWLLSNCYDRLNQKKEGGGWWIYDDISYTADYVGDQYYGNAIEALDACYFIQYHSWLDNYTDERQEITNQRMNYSQALKLNPNTELIDKTITVDRTVTDDYIYTNVSLLQSPTWKGTDTISNTHGAWLIYMSDLSTDFNMFVNKISCNDSAGNYLWHDDFSTDNTSSYNLTRCVYNSTRQALHCIEPAAAQTMYIIPNITGAASLNWVNYSCTFQLTVNYNTTSSLADQVVLYMRRNHSQTAYAGDGGLSLRPFGQDKGDQQTDGAVFHQRWVKRDQRAGIYDNRWETLTNSSAYFAMWTPTNPYYRPESNQIINQKHYYDVDAADICRYAILGGNQSIINDKCTLLQNSIHGQNWLHTLKDFYIQPDGFWSYSESIERKDGGYFTNSIYQISKILRGANGTRFVDLPAVSYYIRHGRENSSEGSATTSWRVRNSMLCAIDSRVCQFTSNEASTGNPFTSDNNVLLKFPDDMNKTIGFIQNNCTDIFAGKMGILYPNNHWKLNYTNGWAYLTESCTNVRISNPIDTMVQDAYQEEGTTNATIVLSPIPYPSTTWYAYGYQLGYTNNESMPEGKIKSTASTYWNNTAHKWINNITKTESFSFTISAKANMSVQIQDGNASTFYNVSRDGAYIGQIQTDNNGDSNATLFESTGNNIISFTLASAPAVPMSGVYQLVYVNVTNNSQINLSRLPFFIGGLFQSHNLSTTILYLFANGSLASQYNAAVNNTWEGFNTSNLTVGIYDISVNYTFNTTGVYTINITNISGVGVSSPTIAQINTAGVAAICSYSYTAFVLLGIVLLVFIIVGALLLINGASIGLLLSVALGAAMIIIMILFGFVTVATMCSI